MHKNQFDKIRILAALVVIFSHHYPLTGNKAPAWLANQWLHWSFAGGVGVMVFFCISGYLVTMSWYREPHFIPFLWKRFLRLWPGMLGSVLCCALIFGVIFNRLPIGDYLNNSATWRFLWLNLTLLAQTPFLPEAFASNPVPLVMNGVYWTIPIEFTCYLILAGLGLAGILRHATLIKVLLLLYVTAFLLFSNPDITGQIRHWIEYPAYFAAGSLIAMHKDWFAKYSGKILFVMAPALVATYFLTPYTATSRFLLLPVLIIYLGSLPAKESWFTRLGDPSYGIYLYGYPIAQAVAALWPDMNFWFSLALTFALSICAGYASWLLLESRALRWKNAFQSSASASLQIRGWTAVIPWAWAWPLLPCFFGLRFIVSHFNDPVAIDAQFFYLPLARSLLEEGWSVLLRPESYHAAPLSYLWPALWAAEPNLIRTANMFLWVGCVWFMWRTCYLLGGIRVGALAMLLMLSPEMVRYFPSELTEPIYLFGLLGWMHAVAQIIMCPRPCWRLVIQGACMLTITLLSRPVLQFIAPTILLACLGCMAYWTIVSKDTRAPSWRQSLMPATLSIGLGLILPIALIIKNGLVFGLWGIGTGSGIGLYLGTHPLFQGAEPAFLGLGYDINLMTKLANIPDDLRSVVGNAVSSQAAMWHIQSMTAADAFTFFGRKLWWWLAHHPAQVQSLGGSLRKLRFFELLTLGMTIGWLAYAWLCRAKSTYRSPITPRQFTLATGLLAMLLAMLAQLMPILHNSRYSSALLDPWLIPLTALGLALLTRQITLRGTFNKSGWSIGWAGREGASPWPSAVALMLITALTFGGYNYAKKNEYVAIDPAHMGETMVHLEITNSDRIDVQGMKRQGEREWIMNQSPAAFLVQVNTNDIVRTTDADIFNALWKTNVSLHTEGRCVKVESAYQTIDGRILQPANKLPLTLPVQTDGKPHSLVTHANDQLRPREPGYLRLVLHCPVGTRVEWHGTRLLESRHAWDAAAHVKR